MENKQIDHISNIMSKCQCNFMKTVQLLISNARKTENLLEFEFDKFENTILWR